MAEDHSGSGCVAPPPAQRTYSVFQLLLSTVARTVCVKTKRDLKKMLYSEVISGSSFYAHSFLYQLGLSSAALPSLILK